MGEQEPETKDGLGEDIKDGIGDDLGVDVDVVGSISDTPDATDPSVRVPIREVQVSYMG